MELGELVSCTIDYFSLSVALMLGVIAYYQTQAINELEYSKYNVFVGIEKLDYSISYEQPFEWKNLNKGFSSLQSVSSTKKTLVSYLNMFPTPDAHGSGKLIHIPLVFVTRNDPLIVSIDIQKISVETFSDDVRISKKVFRDKGTKYHAIINDGERFNVCLGIVCNDAYDVFKMQLKFDIVLEDHHGRKHKLQTNAVLLNQSGGLFLTSTHTKRTAA